MKRNITVLLFLLLAQFTRAQINIAQDDSMIRASRIRTNELIADHDLKGLARYWLKDYVRIAGNGSISIGKDSSMAYWAKSFKDQPTISYVRTPTEIIISENGLLAWENGTGPVSTPRARAAIMQPCGVNRIIYGNCKANYTLPFIIIKSCHQ